MHTLKTFFQPAFSGLEYLKTDLYVHQKLVESNRPLSKTNFCFSELAHDDMNLFFSVESHNSKLSYLIILIWFILETKTITICIIPSKVKTFKNITKLNVFFA